MTDRDAKQEAVGVCNEPQRERLPRGGALLLLLAIAYAVLVAGIVVPVAIAGEAPYFSDAQLVEFYAHHPGAARLLALLVLTSAMPLAVFSSVVAHRVRDARRTGLGG